MPRCSTTSCCARPAARAGVPCRCVTPAAPGWSGPAPTSRARCSATICRYTLCGEGDSAPLAAGRHALGWWLVGTSRAMLALARQHALDRTQFGRPVASFQAIRHRLAETLVAIEGAEATLVAAAAEPDELGFLLAKAAAGQAALTAARHCQQVLGGIGFTAEHDLHRHIKRALVLDGLLGSSRELTARPEPLRTRGLRRGWPALLRRCAHDDVAAGCRDRCALAPLGCWMPRRGLLAFRFPAERRENSILAKRKLQSQTRRPARGSAHQ